MLVDDHLAGVGRQCDRLIRVTPVAVIAALVTWRAPDIVNSLLFRPGTSASLIADKKRQLRAGLVSLVVLDVLFVSIDPTLLSVFLRVKALTVFNPADADIVLSTFQTITLWMVVMSVASLVATAAVIVQLRR